MNTGLDRLEKLENLTSPIGWMTRVFGSLRRFGSTSPPGIVALAFVFILAIVAVFPSQIAPYHPLTNDYSVVDHPPTLKHPLGTDRLGRDILTRVLFGARITLLVAVVSVGMGVGVGFAWGIVTGYVGGRFDLFTQRLLDVLVSFPGVILALLLLVALGAGLTTVIVAIAVTQAPGATRVIRSVVLSAREAEFVESARAIGASPIRIVLLHVSPQTFAPLVVVATINLGGAIFSEAALSFLGVGIPPPDPTWGNMLGGVLGQALKPPWWLVLFPGTAITITILAVNLLGDGLRDHLDPRLRGRL